LFSHYLVDVPVRESRSWLNQFARGVPFGLVAVALLCLVLYMQVNHFAVSWRAALGKVLNFSTWVDEWESSPGLVLASAALLLAALAMLAVAGTYLDPELVRSGRSWQ